MKLVKFNEKDFVNEEFEMVALLNIVNEYGDNWTTGKIIRDKFGRLLVAIYNYDYNDYHIMADTRIKDVKFYASLD